MIVVSNTSPITNLAAIGPVNLLEQLYGKVAIPKAVEEELAASEDLAVRSAYTLSWIETRPVANNILADSLLLELHPGEAEAVALAREMNADLLLVDERRGRKAASRLQLGVLGLLGPLAEAKQSGFSKEVKPVLDDLITKAGFWVSRELYARVLEAAAEIE